MKILNTSIPDVKLLEPQVFGDERGCFFETFRQQWFKEHLVDLDFVQENQSHSLQGTLRGLHYQLRQPQGKLIRVVSGEIFDVCVDLRLNSPSFGQWTGHHLSADNKHQLWVPPGFAHGFYVISPEAHCLYKCTDYYAPNDEHSIRWDDASLAIDWPLLNTRSPILSPKDKAAGTFAEADYYE
ncbi:dTDP-4-dehydrorhamnose 3,5-epimerase [Shewanella halotolerans]|uniref:dTDP-4-dehydrorhamnose 3,5-epimerase n=1 Tax=Shewanella halotolerans TaxID=2864204 RepID=UPI001C6557C0|nr:dTDP-4-dehydrorhamnose 3,5-epimerase [Shewanella halotolerans]QYJ89906.1 dTDP-4-dehydrorhamnose 3,5-epimerase [Shewanella halotolerans]